MEAGKELESLTPHQAPGEASSPPEQNEAAGVVSEEATTSLQPSAHIFYIETERISPNPHQPRREFNEEELGSLASSIKQYGVLQPLVVTKREIDHQFGRRVEYELLAGERRLRAARLAGFTQVPVIIKEADDQKKLELALIENVQREDLNPIEEAQAYKKLADNFSFTQEEIAERVGKSREAIANKIRLLSLPRDVQQYVSDGFITEGHAKALLAIENQERLRVFAKETIKHQWSVRALEAHIRQSFEERHLPHNPDPVLQEFKKLVEETLGANVSISGNHTKGRLAIEFHSPDDLKRLVARLTGSTSEESDVQASDVETPFDEGQSFTV
jgi:ParB family chromosome partitioning protein